MTLTVGICTFNRSQVIGLCLNALLKQTELPDKIIIADSSSNDETELLVKNINSDRILYLRYEERTDIPSARNIILASCTTDIITYLDDDAVPVERFIKAVKETFAVDKETGGVTGPTINSDMDCAPIISIIYDNKKRTHVYSWGEVRTDTRRWVNSEPLECYVMLGANQSYRTDILKEINGFDENYVNPSFREESDLQIRILRKGYKFVYHPDVFVNHIVNQRGGIDDFESKQKTYFYLAGKNHRYFCDKHFPKWKSRAAWILWNRNPPSLFFCFALLFMRRSTAYFYWHKGLWGF